MKSTLRQAGPASLGLLAAMAAAIALPGCGGGGGAPGGSALVDATHGSIQFRVVFPSQGKAAHSGTAAAAVSRGPSPFDGSIPHGAHSVKITLTSVDTGAQLASRVVSDQARPNGVTGSIAVGFPLVPVGNVRADVIASPALDATGNALATGSVTTQVLANQISNANVLMALTFDHLVVSPKNQILHTNVANFPVSVTVDATAFDVQGNPLLYPLQYSSNIPSVAAVTAVTPDFMHATVSANMFFSTPTPVTITVTEPNSGTTGTATVVVGP